MKKAVQFIVRYRIIHIIFWLYLLFSLYHEMEQRHPFEPLRHFVDSSIIIISEILAVYIPIYYLMPRMIEKEKYFRLVAASFAILIAGGLLQAFLEFIIHTFVLHSEFSQSVMMTVITFFFGALPIILALSGIILSYDYYVRSEKNKLLEKERLETELNFLKSQINPHFLFNALNSIYVLMKEDIRLSEQTLLKFSSLLRYQLYECNTNETTIENEIEFLKNYIALENVRNGENRIVNFTTPGHISFYKIAPFILIPFVENSFKHISHFPEKVNKIDINIWVKDNIFHFNSENTYDDSLNSEMNAPNGIGLQNVKRRLELLYSNKYSLKINRNENIHKVELSIHLNEN